MIEARRGQFRRQRRSVRPALLSFVGGRLTRRGGVGHEKPGWSRTGSKPFDPGGTGRRSSLRQASNTTNLAARRGAREEGQHIVELHGSRPKTPRSPGFFASTGIK